MKFMFIILLFFLSTNCFAQKKIALVIGNEYGGYVDPITSPLQDVISISNALKNLGFDRVVPLINAPIDELHTTINLETKSIKDGDLFFFYFAGGIIEGHDNYPYYIFPFEPENGLETAVEIQSILSMITAKSTNIFVFDVCSDKEKTENASDLSSGLFLPKNTSLTSYVSHAFSMEDRDSITCGAMHPFGTNGLFAGSFLKEMVKTELSLSEVFDNTRFNIKKAYPTAHLPITKSNTLGTLYLSKGLEVPPPYYPAVPKTAGEAKAKVESLLKLWEENTISFSPPALATLFNFPIKDYFGTLNMTRDAYYKQENSSLAKYPADMREYQIKKLEITTISADRKTIIAEVEYSFEYNSNNPKKYSRKKGTSKNIFTFEWVKGRYYLTVSKEKVSKFPF